jgi:nucleotide-binding universal stress UspA family protein
MNEVVVGVNRTDRAKAVAERAAEMAARLDATLYVVMCVDRGETSTGGGGYAADRAADHQRFLDGLSTELGYPRVASTLASGDPADVMCSEADRLDAQLIVVGNHRAQGVASALGSVARDVTKHAPCDVLIVNSNH